MFRKLFHCFTIDANFGQYIFMAIASTWIFICFIDQLLNRLFSITYNIGRNTLCSGNNFIVDNQYTKIETSYKLGSREQFFVLLAVAPEILHM